MQRLTTGEKAEVERLQAPSPKTKLDRNNYGGGVLWYRVIASFLDTSVFVAEEAYIGPVILLKAGRKGAYIDVDTKTGGFMQYDPGATAGRCAGRFVRRSPE
jgi:hypothetical protein